MNRETWLDKAVDLLRPYFKSRGYELPEKVKVSCGWPSRGGLSVKNRVLGECWPSNETGDGVKQIYVSPVVSKGSEVLGVLVHELGHAALADGVGYKKPFKKFCEVIGLEGPATHTVVGIDLGKILTDLLEDERDQDYDTGIGNDYLPAYPQADIIPTVKEKKQTTRMHKLVCPKSDDHAEEDILIRASKKVLALGIPSCFCGKEFEVVDKENNENDDQT